MSLATQSTPYNSSTAWRIRLWNIFRMLLYQMVFFTNVHDCMLSETLSCSSRFTQLQVPNQWGQVNFRKISHVR